MAKDPLRRPGLDSYQGTFILHGWMGENIRNISGLVRTIHEAVVKRKPGEILQNGSMTKPVLNLVPFSERERVHKSGERSWERKSCLCMGDSRRCV